jgi:ribosomal protein L29
MKKRDMKKMKADELDKKYKEAKSELIVLQSQANTGTPPKSPGQIKKLKRMIARINTLKNASKTQRKEER